MKKKSKEKEIAIKDLPAEERPKAYAKEIGSWVLTFALAFLVVFLLESFVIVNARVPSGSMLDTIQIGDRLIASRLSYKSESPQRGDIVIFKYPDDEKQKFVKRIIGLPGETVEIKDGGVYINGSATPLTETYIKEKPVGHFGPYTVPEHSYFMMGDNRNDSLDSRYWTNTFVKEDKILGKVKFRYFPGIQTIE